MNETPERVPSDTGWWSQGRDRATKRLFQMLGASVLFHAFLTPGPALLGLIAMLPALEVPNAEDLVEVELTTLPLGATAPEPTPPEQAPEPEAAEPAPAVEAEPEVAPEQPKAPEEAPPEEPEPAPAPTEDDTSAPPAPSFGDPVALAGDAGQIADPNANVRLMIYATVIREHAIGAEVGKLLRRTPQWSDFFGTSDIDPIRDVDRVLIAGPQLRDSSEVVAVVQHHLPPERIDAAFDQLVARKGEWIDREAHLARARADRAPRLFAAPNDKLVIVTPPQLEKQVRSLGQGSLFPAHDGTVAMTAYVVTPANVAKGTGIRLPDTLKWARLDLRPTPDGGGVLQLLAQDKDEASAKHTAQLVEALLGQVTIVESAQRPRGGGFAALASAFTDALKVKVKSLSIREKGSQIEGKVEFTAAQLVALADLSKMFLPPEKSESGASALPGAGEGASALKKEKPGAPSQLPKATPPKEAGSSSPSSPQPAAPEKQPAPQDEPLAVPDELPATPPQQPSAPSD